MKNYDKNKEPPYLMYFDTNNFYGWAMSQKLTLDSFKCEKMPLNLMKNLLKIMMTIVKKDIFME